MKQEANQHRSERSFYVGDWVFLWLHIKQDIDERETLAILHHLRNGDLT